MILTGREGLCSRNVKVVPFWSEGLPLRRLKECKRAGVLDQIR